MGRSAILWFSGHSSNDCLVLEKLKKMVGLKIRKFKG
jgi:hypothetical protein